MPHVLGRLWWLSDKESACQTRDSSSIIGLGSSPEEGNDNTVFLLEKSMDRGAWQAIVHEVTKNQTCLSDQTTTTATYAGFVFWTSLTLCLSIYFFLYFKGWKTAISASQFPLLVDSSEDLPLRGTDRREMKRQEERRSHLLF